MDRDALIQMLHEKLDGMPQGKEEIDRLAAKFADDPDADAGDFCLWLSASIFYTMTWEKRHIAEGETAKVQIEKERTIVANKAIELLKPLIKIVPVDSMQGSI